MSAHLNVVRSLVHNSRLVLAGFTVALVSALAVIAVHASVASASQDWHCYGYMVCYAPRSGNIYELKGTNYSRAGDVCVEISGHGGTLRCNGNPNNGVSVFYLGDQSHPIYGLPVVSTNYGDYATLAGHSY